MKELDHAKSCMERAFTYVEDQLNTLQAAQPTLMSSAPASAFALPPTSSFLLPASVALMATHPI